MSVSKIIIEDGCTACGLCEDVCPDIFSVDDVCVVSEDADFDANEEDIRQAAEECPVEVITVVD
jgi:ferredoxin